MHGMRIVAQLRLCAKIIGNVYDCADSEGEGALALELDQIQHRLSVLSNSLEHRIDGQPPTALPLPGQMSIDAE